MVTSVEYFFFLSPFASFSFASSYLIISLRRGIFSSLRRNGERELYIIILKRVVTVDEPNLKCERRSPISSYYFALIYCPGDVSMFSPVAVLSIQHPVIMLDQHTHQHRSCPRFRPASPTDSLRPLPTSLVSFFSIFFPLFTQMKI